MKKLSKIAVLVLALSIASAIFTGCNIDKYNASKTLTDYSIVAEYNEITKQITATQEVEYFNYSEEVMTSVVFNLFANGYNEGLEHSAVSLEDYISAYPEGASYGGIAFQSVLVDDTVQEYEVSSPHNNALIVDLGKELYPHEKVEITLEYVVTLANVRHRLGACLNVVNFGNWHPVMAVYEDQEFKTYPYYSNGDPFYMEAGNYELEFTIASDFVLAYSGNLDKVVEIGNKKTYKLSEDAIREFAFVASKDFKVLQGEVGDTTVSYYYLNEDYSEEYLDISIKALEFFNETFGEYDYDNLSVVQTAFLHGGMEFSNLVYISDTLTKTDADRVIVHEIAHEWWYMMVHSNQVEDAWIDEGLTEYSTALFFEKVMEDDSLKKSGENSYKAYLKLTTDMNVLADPNMEKTLGEFKTSTEYVIMTYCKGQMLFEDICTYVGEEVFMDCLKLYFEDNKYELADKGDLISSFNTASGKNLSGFIEGYMIGRIFV